MKIEMNKSEKKVGLIVLIIVVLASILVMGILIGQRAKNEVVEYETENTNAPDCKRPGEIDNKNSLAQMAAEDRKKHPEMFTGDAPTSQPPCRYNPVIDTILHKPDKTP